MATPTPAAALRLAQAIPETAENFPNIRELVQSPKDLVAIAEWADRKSAS